MAEAEKTTGFEVVCPSGLARALSMIARERGVAIDAAEFAEAVRLCEECRRADLGAAEPGRQDGLLPRSIPVGCLVVRTPTIRARLVLQTAGSCGRLGPADGGKGDVEYWALLTAWVLHHGRDGDELARLTEATAPGIVADLRARMGATLGELQAAIGEVTRDLYPEASLLELWADQEEERSAPDWAGVLLTLASEGCGATEALLDAPEPQVHHLFAGLRRQRQAEAAAWDRHSSAAPDPQSPKCRAARAWTAFESQLRTRRAIRQEETVPMKRERVTLDDGRSCEVREMTWAELRKVQAEGETLAMEWPLEEQFKGREAELDGLGVSEVRKLAERVYGLTLGLADGGKVSAGSAGIVAAAVPAA